MGWRRWSSLLVVTLVYDNEEAEEEASRPVCVVAGDDDGLS